MPCDMSFDDTEIGKSGEKEQCLVASLGLKGIGVTTFCRGDIAAANSGEI